MNLEIEKFNQTKEELSKLAKKYANLEINGVDDKTGYSIVDEARKDLKNKRVLISKTGKAMRDDANKFAKNVISLEKELIAMIEPLEKSLQNKQRFVDEEKLKIKRQGLLPDRKKQLSEIDIELTDDEILMFDNAKFDAFVVEQKSAFLYKKEQELKAKEQEIARKKELEEAKKQAVLAAEKQAAAREKQLKIDAENAAKQAEIDKKNAVEAERLRIEKAEKDRIEAERIEKEKTAKNKIYKEWLAKNNYNEDEYIVQQKDNTFIMYKIIDSITIK